MTAAYFVGGSQDLTKRWIEGGESSPPPQDMFVPLDPRGGPAVWEVYELAHARVMGPNDSFAVYRYAGQRGR